MSGIIAFEEDLNSIVKEYLEFNSLNKTVTTFTDECEEQGKRFSPPDPRPSKNNEHLIVQNKMTQAFTVGNRRNFFLNWKEYIQKLIRPDDVEADKLEFYIHIYFAIFPLKYPSQGGDHQEEMREFRKFIETKGASLSQTSEFLPFYALPFVPNPRTHPSFQELFSDNWIPDLQEKLEKFLSFTLQSNNQPRLFEIYRSFVNKEDKGIQEHIQDSERKVATYLKRHNRLQTDYRNLIAITADLVDSLEKSIQGDMVTPEYLEKMCNRLFSNQVQQSVNLSRPGTAAEVLRRSVLPPQGLEFDGTLTDKSLDYEKIKQDMIDSNERLQCLLMQALRWKLTKTAPAERVLIMSAYAQNDLLSCKPGSALMSQTLNLLINSNSAIKESAIRLFNTFASLFEGRSYLIKNSKIIPALLNCLKKEKDPNSLIREHAIGCLQKLSLRHDQQTKMIDLGLIEWLIELLEDTDSLSDYTLEYASALLMNLCLRPSGKKRCAKNAHEILKVLTNLLGMNDNKDVIPYVNGTLYSILTVREVRDEGQNMGLEEMLTSLMKNSPPESVRQFNFIIKQLKTAEEPDDIESEEEDDDDDEQEFIEADLDRNEAVNANPNELSGERLLNSNYILSNTPMRTRKKFNDHNDFSVSNSTITSNQSHSPPNILSIHSSLESVCDIYLQDKQVDALKEAEEVLRRPVTPGQRYHLTNPVVHFDTNYASNSKTSLNNSRPPTRTGSRPNSGEEIRPSSKNSNNSKGSQKSQHSGSGKLKEEHSTVFSSRPKIPRTPDTSSRRNSSQSGRAPPQPHYSESLPSPRPGSGGSPLK